MKFKYPSLYTISNKRAAKYQKYYFCTLRFEYAILIFNAVNAFATYDYKYYVSLALFVVLMLMMLFQFKKKFEQEWYKYRAITESIKTISWKYAMKSEPFNNDDESKNISILSSYLNDIVGGSEFISKSIDQSSVTESTVTNEMKSIRSLPYTERRDIYVQNRVIDQRDWYITKAQSNKDTGKIWAVGIFLIYLFSFSCSLFNALNTHKPELIMPISILTTIASSLVGWVQVKRYSELSASYFLTAHEIGVIKEQSSYVYSDDDFSEFVRDAEIAFSREHTQWLARRVANRKPR